MSDFVVERLAAHDRSRFDCGTEALNRYVREQVGQDVRRAFATCFVALDQAGAVAAYYTLSASSLALTDLPEAMRRKLPRYPVAPAAIIGRLAVDRSRQGLGLGAALIVDAAARARASDLAAHILVVDATDQAAAKFYARMGFAPLDGASMRFVRSLAR